MKPSRFTEVSPVTERLIQEINQGDESIELLTGEPVSVKAVLCEGPVEVGGESPIAWERYLPLVENG